MDWHRYFTYDPATGSLLWKKRPASDFATQKSCNTWNTRFAGTVAGALMHRRGGRPQEICVHVNARGYRAHRIIYEMHHGLIPEDMQIDHIDGNPFNNKLENLRPATNAENLFNRGKNKNNTSGFKGAFWVKGRGKWRSEIRTRGTRKHLGYFTTAEEAHAAYCKAAQEQHQEFHRTQ